MLHSTSCSQVGRADSTLVRQVFKLSPQLAWLPSRYLLPLSSDAKMILTYVKMDLHKTCQDRILTRFGDWECVYACVHVHTHSHSLHSCRNLPPSVYVFAHAPYVEVRGLCQLLSTLFLRKDFPQNLELTDLDRLAGPASSQNLPVCIPVWGDSHMPGHPAFT